MTDIVERLRKLEQVERELAHECDCPPETTVNWTYAETCQNAADEIERLRAALRMIAGNLHTGWQGDTARDALDGQPAPSGWRPIETAPKDGSRMLIAYQTSLGKWRRVIAFYASKLAVEQNDNESDWCEYDEANGRYCLPEGWYECIENWDDYSSVHMSGVEPTHWMPLPPAPGKEVK